MLEFRLLGPVEIWIGAKRLDTGMPRQRTVLAALLADVGHVVAVETLVDRIWGEEPPRTARHSLYSHITRIRNLMAQAAPLCAEPPRLIRRSGGYLLDTDPSRVDLHRARHLVALAGVLMRALAASGRAADALQVYASLRRRLSDELGADPNGEVQAVHRAILRGELRPASAATVGYPTTMVRVRPAQLPAAVHAFAGRGAYLSRLDTLLAQAGRPTVREPAGVRPRRHGPGAGRGDPRLPRRHERSRRAGPGPPRRPDGPLPESAGRQADARAARQCPRRRPGPPAAARDARLPLALALVAAHAATRPRVPLRVLADQLHDTRRRWHPLTGDDPTTDVRAVFSWSYRALDPQAARLFRLLGADPASTVSTATLVSLAGCPVAGVLPSVAALVEANLLVECAPGRYTLHDLLRAYATELGHLHDPADARDEAVTRLLDHYTHTANTADRLLHPHSAPIPVPLAPPVPGTGPESLADPEQAATWLATEYPGLRAVLHTAWDQRHDARTWQLAWALDTYLDRRGCWHDLAATWRVALRCAQRLDDPAAQAVAHRMVAHTDTLMGRHPQALTVLTGLDHPDALEVRAKLRGLGAPDILAPGRSG